MRILIQPFEDISAGILEDLIANLPRYFPGSEAVLSDVGWEMPHSAYNPQRDQYLARFILEPLAAWGHEQDCGRVVGICIADLYASGFNFIFGEAEYPGNAAIISLHRLGGTPQEVRERALKEAIHELGHTFGLKHCRKSACIMSFSETLRDTDVKGLGFCEKCFLQLNRPSVRQIA